MSAKLIFPVVLNCEILCKAAIFSLFEPVLCQLGGISFLFDLLPPDKVSSLASLFPLSSEFLDVKLELHTLLVETFVLLLKLRDLF